MPNWCDNEVDINGSQKDVKKLTELVTKEFDFNKIIPMPEELEGFTSKIISQEEFEKQEKKYKKWLNTPEKERETPFFSRGITQKMSDRFKKEYGEDNWYHWCIKNWGVKWEASSVRSDSGDGWAKFEFMTPWGPPEQICKKLRELFPSVNITWFYTEPGMQLSGWL